MGLPPEVTSWLARAWLPTPWRNERTTAMRSANCASLGNVPPKVTPGSDVATSPNMLRYSTGAVIFGSKVSTCVGPPCRNNSTTDLSLTKLLDSARARVASESASVRPPNPSAPTLMNSRPARGPRNRDRRRR